MAKKTPLDKAALLKERHIFCTECGTYLENFCFSNKADDVEAIKKSLAQCKKDGKFVGDFCSQLFIGDSGDLGAVWDDGEENK